MKKNAPLIGFLSAIGVMAVAFAIYFLFLAKKNYYLVDNPTGETYYFRLNKGDEKIIAAGQMLKVNLNKGKNAIQVFDAKKDLLYDSAFVVNKNRGLVNIAHQDYYINEQFYGYGLNKDSLITARKSTIIDGKKFVNEPKHFNKLYTDDFYYNIDEDYDKVVKNVQKVESRTKIFRKVDFLNYYKEYYKF